MAGFMKKMFRGMETPAEEKKEAKALKSGKITPKQYVAGEKSEGHGAGAAKKAAAIKSGKLSPAKYAKEHASKKMAGGGCTGKPKKMALGGMPSPLPRDVGTGAGPRGSVGGVKGPLPQAVDPVRPRGMPSPLPRDVGVGGGPRGASLPVKGGLGTTGGPKPSPLFNQPIRSAPVGGKPGPVNMVRKAKGGGVEAKGKTAGKTVKMAKGGGVEVKGKTKGRMC